MSLDFDIELAKIQQRVEKYSESYHSAVKIVDAVKKMHLINSRLEAQLEHLRNKVEIYHKQLWHRMDSWRSRAISAERKLKRLDK